MPIDYSKYPPNWKTEIRPYILKRAKNCCEECGFENGLKVLSYKEDGRTFWVHGLFGDLVPDNHKEVKVVLTVAHLDHDESNHEVSYDRLKAMCQLCHLRYDSEEKNKRRNLKKINQ